MKISRGTVATLSYVVTDEQGQVLGRTMKDEPVEALIGYGYLVPGFEKALDGHESGDELKITLNPAEAYGEYNPALVQELDKDMFGGMEFAVGDVFEAEAEQGTIPVVIKEIKDHTVVVDSNHPLAGKTLMFLAEVLDVRESTEEERKHGHVHHDGHCPGEEEHCCCHHRHDGDEEAGHCCHHHHRDGDEEGHCCHHHHHEHSEDEHHEHHHHEHDEGEHHEHHHH
ncbi:MAG: peptidylprolyl isomerase [Succinivibrio sp.]|nr:peptidylprolyl isomerase [Succinivibrio sp.]